MTPHHLHALAAAHSLDAAIGADDDHGLRKLAKDEAAQIAAELLEAPSVLRSTVYGGTFGSGGYSDPTPAAVAVADRAQRRNRWAEMMQRLDGRLGWICGQIPGPVRIADYTGHILDRLPHLPPGTAAVVGRHLADEERWVRAAIGLPRPTAPLMLAGGDQAECPGCRRRSLTVQQVGPREAWTVVCDGRWDNNVHNPCLCTGQGCPCGMSGAVEGVAHIWWRRDVLGAAGGQQ